MADFLSYGIGRLWHGVRLLFVNGETYHREGQCEYGKVHGPTCYCHRPGTKKVYYGEDGFFRWFCDNHYDEEAERVKRYL